MPCFEAHKPTPPSCSSPCYAAPELVISEGVYIGLAIDIWSCGVIIYAMLWVQWGSVSQYGWKKCQLVVFVNVLSTVDSHIRHTPSDTVRGMPYKGVCPVRVTPKIDHKKLQKITKNF